MSSLEFAQSARLIRVSIALSALVSAITFSVTGTALERLSLTPTGPGRIGDGMGTAVSLSGDVAVVGAPATYVNPDVPSGAATLYRNTSSGWRLEAYLLPQVAIPNMGFGYATATDSDVAVIGSWSSQLTTFEHVGSTWTEVDTFVASVFHDIGLSGDTLVAAGTVYLRQGSGWQVQAELPGDDNESFNNVSIDGDIVAASSQKIGVGCAISFFSRSDGVWTREARFPVLCSTIFYYSIHPAVSGHTAIVSEAPDPSSLSTVHVFDRDDAGAWSDDGTLDAGVDLIGDTPVAVDGDVALVGSPDDGVGYRFVRSGGVWTRDREFEDPSYSGCFTAVALAGATALVGCPDGRTPSGGIGKADVFSFDTNPPNIVAQFDQGDSYAQEQFGTVVSISGSTFVARGWHALRVFDHAGGAWTFDASIEVPPGLYLASTLALDGDTLAVPYLNPQPGGRRAVAVYVRTGQDWTQQAYIEGGSESASSFGGAIGLRADTLVIGESQGSGGVCHVYTRSGTTWSETATVQPTENVSSDLFCQTLATDSENLLVGAPNATVGTTAHAGAAYMFVRNGAGWTEQARIVMPTPETGAGFGSSLALAGDTAVIGAPRGRTVDDMNGAAYVFHRDGENWSFTSNLRDLIANPPRTFAYSLGISGDQATILVGAPLGAPGAPDDGAVWRFTLGDAEWTFESLLTANPPPSDATTSDGFGLSIAVSGSDAIIGSPYEGVRGAVYVGGISNEVFANGFDP